MTVGFSVREEQGEVIVASFPNEIDLIKPNDLEMYNTSRKVQGPLLSHSWLVV